MKIKIWRFNLKKYFLFTLTLLFFTVSAQDKPFTVVIDPGHGRNDGASRSYSDLGLVREDHVALDISLKLQKLLSKEKDIKVIMTRTTHVYPSLSQRTDLANKSSADLFISIHLNSTGTNTTQATGAETYVQGPDQNNANLEVAKRENSVIYLDEEDRRRFEHYNPNSPESLIALKIQQAKYLEKSLLIGSLIQDNLENDGQNNRGVKQKNLHVLRQNAMPSVLVETGFINNHSDASYLTSSAGQEKVANSIYRAILKYKKEIGFHPNIQPVEPEKPKEVALENDFRILILSSPTRYLEGDPALRGLKYILRIKEGDVYKYYYANTNLASIRDENLKRAKEAGFKNAAPVAFIPNIALSKGYYTIEVAVSKQRLNNNSYILKNLRDLKRTKKKGSFYYTYGNVKTFEAAVNMQKQIEAKGIINTTIEKVLE